MCIVCVSAVTVASLVAPTSVPVVQNSVTEYVITKAACPKSKVNKIENNRICLKNGMVYRWAIKKPTILTTPVATPTPIPLPTTKPTPTQTPIPTQTLQPNPTPQTTSSVDPNTTLNNMTYDNPSDLSDNIENCKIKEVNINGPRNGRAGPEGALIPLPSGFPSVTPLTQNTGTVKWALIPIDFPDLKGESNFKDRVENQMKTLSDWYFTVSEGKLKIEWVVANNWVTLSSNTSSYKLDQSINLTNSQIGQKLFVDAMNASDPTFNFTNVQQVNFILPKAQSFLNESSQGFPWDKVVRELRTQEGYVSGFTIPGKFFDLPGKEYWSYWAHEFGHSISLAHVGASRGEMPPFNPWDLMGGQDGPSKELSGWLRFLANWLPSEKVFCKESNKINNLSVTLVPLSSKDSGIKFVVVPVSPIKAILIESRRVTNFSCTTQTARNGVLVYTYDARLSHNEDFLVPISPIERPLEKDSCGSLNDRSGPTRDVLLYAGQKVTVDGITVTVTANGKYDKITISR